jgi:hypothetical protein
MLQVGGREILLAVAADGAGSAKRSEAGAALACAAFLRLAEARILATGDLSAIDRSFFFEVLADVQASVRECAAREEAEPNDYACTFLAAAIDDQSAAFAQLGDGAIVVSAEAPDLYAWVFWPQSGEYANATYFITGPDAFDRIAYACLPRRIAELALFTDGVQSLALQLQAQTVHQPFFRSVFRPMRTGDADAGRLCAGLGVFLASEAVNARTDDDKTLILASRATT